MNQWTDEPMEIEKYRNDLEIIRLTAEQIIKDFEIFGHEIKFSGEWIHSLWWIKKSDAPLLFKLYQNNTSTFQSLLYRMTSVKKISWIAGNIITGNFSNELADAVIQREFKKCWQENSFIVRSRDKNQESRGKLFVTKSRTKNFELRTN